ncbi:type II toxin-antitoxin system VapC family toxin [Paracoccus versutus]|uniref:type II toxin-antitoxin system VapC family toxin n=1 Tax=Paracoccus versutus TaxID=34007 RepID=UPI000DF83CD4|nr:type II toxin-antitoxin system VapC family toxin [Paracoccus versutus]RDD70323.1 type II toxin-antitoxin system VapC family toxin [Paracoccus versutus]
MILVDTSIWIDHLRAGDAELVDLLNTEQVMAHPFIIGELALGSLKDRETVIAAMQGLPQAPVASHDEVMALIRTRRLFSLGIGYVDAHLIAATLLAPGTTLWTRDRRLKAATKHIDFPPKG